VILATSVHRPQIPSLLVAKTMLTLALFRYANPGLTGLQLKR
jgi:hypothetical protein